MTLSETSSTSTASLGSMTTNPPVDYVDLSLGDPTEQVEGEVTDVATVITQEEVEVMLKYMVIAIDNTSTVASMLLQISQSMGKQS